MAANATTSLAKRWCFTSFKVEAPTFLEEFMEYLVFQQETSPQTGRLHWQGFVCFKTKIRMPAVKRLLGDNAAHLEVARGTVAENQAYCSKQESAVPGTHAAFGTAPAERVAGLQQNKWVDLKNDIVGGKTVENVILDNFQLCTMHTKGVMQNMLLLRKPPARRRVANLCIYGSTGVGKTHWIHSNFDEDEIYIKDKTEWWDGYTGQKVIVFDDFYGEHKLGTMLNWMDIYRNQVPVKGGYIWLFNEYNIFTSNVHPDQWYHKATENRPDLRAAFVRRLPPSNVVHAQQQGDIPSLASWPYFTMGERVDEGGEAPLSEASGRVLPSGQVGGSAPKPLVGGSAPKPLVEGSALELPLGGRPAPPNPPCVTLVETHEYVGDGWNMMNFS